MNDLNKHIDSIKKHPQLLSTADIKNILINSNHTKNKVYDIMKVKLIAASVLILLTIGILLIINSKDQTLKVNEFALNEYRYASFINDIHNNPDNYKTHITFSKNKYIPMHLTAQIELPVEKLEQMGFKVNNSIVVYEANIKSKGYLKFQIKGDFNSVYMSDYPLKEIKEYDFYPLFLSDLNGRQGVKFRFDNEPENKWDTFTDRINSLIPIVINTPGSNTQNIFWFLPTENLLAILDEKTDYPGPNELPYLNEEIDLVKLYPNPSNGHITIQTDFQKGQIKVELLDINGQLIDVLDNTRITNLSPKYDFNISNIDKGIYLIAVSIDGDYKAFKKLILTY